MAKILIAEDERIVAWDIQDSLERFGHTIVANVASGAEAIQAAVQTSPDLVVMDIYLQGELDGIVTADKIREHLNIPVVFLTARADEQTLNRALASTPFGYLIKPFSSLGLQATIQIALHRYQFEQRLAQAEALLSTTLASIGDGTITVDPAGCVTFMNSAAEALTGWPQAEALGQPIEKVMPLMHAQTGEAIANPLRQAIQQGCKVNLPEAALLCPRNGTPRSVGDSAAPIRQADGEILGGIMVFQDLAERSRQDNREIACPFKVPASTEDCVQQLCQQVQRLNVDLEFQVRERTAQLQQALEFEALLKRITEHMRDSLDEAQILQTVVQELALGVDADCCNSALLNENQDTLTVKYEYSKTLPVLQGKVISMTELADVYEPLLRGEILQFCPLNLPALDPLPAHTAILACPIIDDQQVLGDIWLFRVGECGFSRAEERLVAQVANQCAIALRQSRLYQIAQRQVEELERLSLLKDDFLNCISHELRTPMSSMKLAIQMLEFSLGNVGFLGETAEQIDRYLNILKEECQNEIDLINNLLDLTRLNAAADPLLPTLVDLKLWLPHIAEPYLHLAKQQQQTLLLEIASTLPPIMTDLAYLERIVTELLQNACKYSPPGETITLAAAVTDGQHNSPSSSSESMPSLQPPVAEGAHLSRPSAILLTVTNTGVVIPAAEYERIFERFYRIPNNNPWQHRGTGLGLALVQKLVECLNYRIDVEGGDRYTRFCLHIPLPS